MLDGLTLLYAYENTIGLTLVYVLWFAFILLIGLTVYCWILAVNRITATHLVIALVSTALCVFSLFCAFKAQPHTETLYKVTIDPSVSYREFTYYYEVIDVEGEIYTIREINHDDYVEVPPAPSDESAILETEAPTETPPTWDTSAEG